MGSKRKLNAPEKVEGEWVKKPKSISSDKIGFKKVKDKKKDSECAISDSKESVSGDENSESQKQSSNDSNKHNSAEEMEGSNKESLVEDSTSDDGDVEVYDTQDLTSKVDNTKKQRTSVWVKNLLEQPSDVDEYESFTSQNDDREDMSTLNSSVFADNECADYEDITAECVSLSCEWNECGFATEDEVKYFVHVSNHRPNIETRTKSETRVKVKVFFCLWDLCSFDSEEFYETMRHINFHAYHTKLKNIGTRIRAHLKLTNCMLDYAGRNLLPSVDHVYTCQWQDCSKLINNVRLYFHHVRSHLKTTPRGKCVKKIECKWTECTKIVKTYSKLVDHVRTHTQEKLVGCPTCGVLFSNRAKFQNHCQRQKQIKSFKCSHCQKSYATERLLRAHIKVHVNKYKCPICEMTFCYPSTLATHIRFKHVNSREFQCNFCPHRSVTQEDLETHQLSHWSENYWVCEQEGCEFSCRSKQGLEYHTRRIHGKEWEKNAYVCHICNKKFRLGYVLTKHLKKAHNFTSQSRFRYIKGDDGFFRVQAYRYESIESSKDVNKKSKSTSDDTKYTVIKKSKTELEVTVSNRESDDDIDDDIHSDHSSDIGDRLKKYLGLTAKAPST